MSLRGSIGTRRRRRAVAPRRLERARRELLDDAGLSEREREVLGRADLHVDPLDTMHVGDSGHYLSVGLSALRCIEAAGVEAPRRILDLPCGHGRVLRILRVAYPDAELIACDIDRGGVDFCAGQFGATPIYSAADLATVDLPGDTDLIWCGSLVTHLDERATQTLLGELTTMLAPGGTLVFTTHGRFVADRLASGEADYQLTPTAIDQALAGYREGGYGYADYSWSPGYGVSLTTPGWVEEGAPLPVAYAEEQGWDGHQDVFALRREASG